MLNSEGKFEFPMTEKRKIGITYLVQNDIRFVNIITSRANKIMNEIDFYTIESQRVDLGKGIQAKVDKLLKELAYFEAIGERANEELEETLGVSF